MIINIATLISIMVTVILIKMRIMKINIIMILISIMDIATLIKINIMNCKTK